MFGTECLAAFAEEVGVTGAVAAEGCRTRWELGGPLAAGTRLVRAPSGILEHRPEEMTVRLLAGTLVDELHAELAIRGQRTALPRRGGTVGGALAVGENDLSVLGRGRVRDALLQVRYVAADGAVVQGGGPTVKNVTGFDLPRLIVGSLGTLGLIGDVILRTNPVPVVSRWVESTSVNPFSVIGRARSASCVLWDGTTTWIELEGHAPDVDADLEAIGASACAESGGPPLLPPYRWSLVPSDLRTLDRQAGDWVASVGTGTVFAARPQPPAPVSMHLVALTRRVKEGFDPSARLAPGRMVLRMAP
jgi:glycolate oxidase FAD binding subunit